MNINVYQDLLIHSYEGGEFNHVASITQAENVGDSLFAYLFKELSDREDCDDIDCAIIRMQEAMRQIDMMLLVLQDAKARGVR
jgi:hypothetical protein